MDRFFSFLWPLSLIPWCCCWSQTMLEIKMISHPPQALNTKVELKCETTYMDAGVFWIRHKRDYSTDFILHVSARSKMTPERVTGYKSSKKSTFYQLTIPSFKEENQGIYQCVLFRNQALHFSSGLQVYLPERATQAPTIPPQVSTHSKGLINKETMECPDSTAPDPRDGTMFPCEMYIWAPLAGGCFLLLVMLVITLLVCYDPRRRRRKCKCKRPLKGTNGTLALPR
ncbi:T-cell surface glycoprotein CD8 alpha chain [Rhineura floridana]|uniref:T-cell surface glycoprotein CD8 alpha chain n=1 Tax=Rhineura floridana TaxID=261503 RepID=UPI002AC875C0|nr:T-cell surface glycoprotein CD8 alpha chain [Rhineura floridana]